MSRIAKKPISIASGATVTRTEEGGVVVTGPKGTLTLSIPKWLSCRVGPTEIVLEASAESDAHRAIAGTLRQILANMVRGVTEGFSKSLLIVGTGYRAAMSGKELVLNVGFSHPVSFSLPEGVTATVEKSTIILKGIDKQQVGEIAARIRKIRKPEPYKGIGIRYTDETVRRKAGKQAKGAK